MNSVSTGTLVSANPATRMSLGHWAFFLCLFVVSLSPGAFVTSRSNSSTVQNSIALGISAATFLAAIHACFKLNASIDGKHYLRRFALFYLLAAVVAVAIDFGITILMVAIPGHLDHTPAPLATVRMVLFQWHDVLAQMLACVLVYQGFLWRRRRAIQLSNQAL